MEFTEMEKRMLYQTEGCEWYAVINELSMASQYLKQLSQAVIWLKEHGDMGYENLQKRSDAALLHQAAKKHFDGLGITKLPAVKSLREEYIGLLEQKRRAYSAYKQARADMKELYNVRANVEHLLDIPTGREPQRDTQKSRQ